MAINAVQVSKRVGQTYSEIDTSDEIRKMAKKSASHRRTTSEVLPTCSCLVLCDDVIISHGRDKHRLEGIIGAIGVPFVPHPVPGGVVYVRVSNVHQQQRLTVTFSHADDDHKRLWEIEAEIVNQNQPLDVHTLVARVPPFIATKAGRYLLQVHHKGEAIATVPVTIRAAFPSPPPGWNAKGLEEGPAT